MGTFRESDNKSDRSARDRARNREIVDEVIRKNIADIISEEAIISHAGGKKVRVLIRGLKEYRFTFGQSSGGVGESSGDVEPGDVLKPPAPGQGAGKAGKGGRGKGRGFQGGDAPGEEMYEERTLDELVEIAFGDLELPESAKKRLRELESKKAFRRRGYQRTGSPPRLAKRESARERLKRKKASLRTRSRRAQGERFPFHKRDLRYRRVEETKRRDSNAVIFCVMDASSSMDTTKKYLARMFFYLLCRFVKTKYETIRVIFVIHDTAAHETTEEQFFTRVESGGTHISSGARKALEIAEKTYNPALWNVYYFHCSDGDNYQNDNAEAVAAFRKLTEVSSLVAYAEIVPGSQMSLLKLFGTLLEQEFAAPNLAIVTIRERQELWPAIEQILGRDRAGKGGRRG